MFKLSNLISPDPNFPIWRIERNAASAMMLYKCSDVLYWTIQQGALVPIFSSQLFTIVNEELLFLLNEHVSEQFQYQAVTIYDRPTDSNIPGYYRLCPNSTLEFEALMKGDHSGKRIWIDAGSGIIFISLELHKVMAESNIEGIDYLPGLSFMG